MTEVKTEHTEAPKVKAAAPIKWYATEKSKKVFIIVGALAVVLILVWFFFFHPYVRTDDARVAMTVVRIAPQGVTARVDKLNVDVGSVVKKGDVLLEMDHRATKAQLDRAKAKLVLATKDLDRAKDLVRRGSLPQRDLDTAQANFVLADSEVTIAQVAFENTFLTAPFDGIIVQKSTEVGNILESQQTALAIADRDGAWVNANVEETEIADVKPGQEVKISIDEGGTIWGKVLEVRAATAAQFSLIPADNPSGNFVKVVQRIPIKVSLDSKPQNLKVGQSVVLRIKVR